MKRTFTIISVAFMAAIILVQTSGNEAISNNAGAPAGRTGSPFDNATCASSNCHAGSASPSPTQIITSNIPVTGYVPGQTYTITASPAQAGINKYGFEISPMNASGTLLGTIVVTNPSVTKIVGTKYITHTASGTAGTGGRTWTFNWVAPAAGTGNVTFYGAFNFSNGNTQSNGDIIRTNTMTVSEDAGTAGLTSVTGDPFNTILFPNPLISDATIRLNLVDNSDVIIQYLDLSGKNISDPIVLDGKPGLQEFKITIPSDLNQGIYHLLVQAGNRQAIKTFYKK